MSKWPEVEWVLCRGRWQTWFAWYRSRSWNVRILGRGIGCRPTESVQLFSVRSGAVPSLVIGARRFVVLPVLDMPLSEQKEEPNGKAL